MLAKKLSSRKFWIAVAGYISAIILMVLRAISADAGLHAILYISVAYLGVEGAGDVVQRSGLGQLFQFLFGQKK